MIRFVFLLALVSLSHAITYTRAALDDQITDLPGAPANLPFKQFGGYLLANATTEKYIFYWFVESQTNPETAPLALWTNGGPGCSGLIGFMTEHGPFRPQADGTLALNPYSWNKLANMIYVEQPAGVGFSYSGTKTYKTGDALAAQENYNTILSFLDKFPQYANTPFYLTSESYGGHYLPTLGKYIIDKNNEPSTTKINFKGFAVGNPYTDPTSNKLGNFQTLWGRQVVPKRLWDDYQQYCLGPIVRPVECAQTEVEMDLAYGGLNPYALDYPTCTLRGAVASEGKPQGFWLRQFDKAGRKLDSLENIKERLADYNQRSANRVKFPITDPPASSADPTEYDPCVDDYTVTYLNRKEVQTAIHAQTPPFSGVWAECSNAMFLEYSSADGQNPMEPYYQYILANGNADQDFMVFSGDCDDVCSTMSTQYWIFDLGYNVSVPWHNWVSTLGMSENQQTVGGYITKFGTPSGKPRFSFLTVHGAGHEVPTYKPALAYEVFQGYLNGSWFIRP